MSRKSILGLLALLGVLVLGIGGGYWAYRKIQKKKNQEVACQVTILVSNQFNVEKFKRIILSDDIVNVVVEKNDLVAFWHLSDAQKASRRVRSKFSASLKNADLLISYRGKNPEKTKAVLKSMLDEYQKKIDEQAKGQEVETMPTHRY